MELHDLKTTWQALDRQLTQHNRLQLHLLREQKLEKARNSLRPLFWGQLAQLLLVGLPLIVLASCLWAGLDHLPSSALLLAGVVVHAYGVAVVALAGATMGLVRTLDYSAPVLSIQKQLAKLRGLYVLNAMLCGLPWWFMWVPVLMVGAGLVGVDLYARAPQVAWIGLGVGAVGLLGTWIFHRWARQPSRPQRAQAMRDSLTGGSLRKAQALMAELDHFEKQ